MRFFSFSFFFLFFFLHRCKLVFRIVNNIDRWRDGWRIVGDYWNLWAREILRDRKKSRERVKFGITFRFQDLCSINNATEGPLENLWAREIPIPFWQTFFFRSEDNQRTSKIWNNISIDFRIVARLITRWMKDHTKPVENLWAREIPIPFFRVDRKKPRERDL